MILLMRRVIWAGCSSKVDDWEPAGIAPSALVADSVWQTLQRLHPTTDERCNKIRCDEVLLVQHLLQPLADGVYHLIRLLRMVALVLPRNRWGLVEEGQVDAVGGWVDILHVEKSSLPFVGRLN